MPGDAYQCRLNAGSCMALARRAGTPEAREAYSEMAQTWKRLAAETESDEALFRAISEMDFGEPSEALPPRVETSLTSGIVSF